MFEFTSKKIACRNCGYIGKAKTYVRGNAGIEILLYFFFIIPGIIYSLYRSTQAYKGCPACRSTQIVPLETPAGQQILNSYGKK